MLTRHLLGFILLTISLTTLIWTRQAAAQVLVDFPVCMTDSVESLSGDLANILHPFGDDTITYPNEFEPHRDCRRLYSVRGWSHGTTKQVLT